jgi:hypothetical protein
MSSVAANRDLLRQTAQSIVVLLDPEPARFIGIEEPENFLHPRLLPELAEECRAATGQSQLLATTHSPFFLLVEVVLISVADAGLFLSALFFPAFPPIA